MTAAEQFAKKLPFSASEPKGVVEKTMLTARLKASPDTNREFVSRLCGASLGCPDVASGATQFPIFS